MAQNLKFYHRRPQITFTMNFQNESMGLSFYDFNGINHELLHFVHINMWFATPYECRRIMLKILRAGHTQFKIFELYVTVPRS